MSTERRHERGIDDSDADRRLSPRLDVPERVQCHIRPPEVPIALLNLSVGGFLMQAPVNLPIGDTYEFRFTIGMHEPVMLRARIVRVMRATTGDVACHMHGLEFVDASTPATAHAITSLLALCADARSGEERLS